MNHEIHVKDRGFNASNASDTAMLLYLITALRKRSCKINQGEIDIRMYNN